MAASLTRSLMPARAFLAVESSPGLPSDPQAQFDAILTSIKSEFATLTSLVNQYGTLDQRKGYMLSVMEDFSKGLNGPVLAGPKINVPDFVVDSSTINASMELSKPAASVVLPESSPPSTTSNTAVEPSVIAASAPIAADSSTEAEPASSSINVAQPVVASPPIDVVDMLAESLAQFTVSGSNNKLDVSRVALAIALSSTFDKASSPPPKRATLGQQIRAADLGPSELESSIWAPGGHARVALEEREQAEKEESERARGRALLAAAEASNGSAGSRWASVPPVAISRLVKIAVAPTLPSAVETPAPLNVAESIAASAPTSSTSAVKATSPIEPLRPVSANVRQRLDVSFLHRTMRVGRIGDQQRLAQLMANPGQPSALPPIARAPRTPLPRSSSAVAGSSSSIWSSSRTKASQDGSAASAKGKQRLR